ncbi:MAG TPA: outer membrane beta-barrel family protein [Arachidicoccus sp.]|nr:outer membrane beta-barrel family protein [Arachidicoccus sp.]
MRKRLLLSLCTSLLAMTVFAQQSTTLKGKIIDTSSHEHLENATIMLLAAKDSILQQYARSGKDGSFTLKGVDTGRYVLSVSYPEYADYVEQFYYKGDNAPDLSRITLVQKAHLLEDVIVKQQIAAIRFKGDTTEFNADSFRTQPNASVEDLLKKLPGIQVDKDGKITAQGETVTKVLVDGEEFFGDDPTLVTKNLRADMVDKVQMYDKTSDQAAFTGIDDGNKQKTLNIKLKADKKNGYFGKLSGGVANKDFYQSQDMFNYFKGKKKFSVYGTFGNTGQIGLGFQDQMKYGSGSGASVEMMDGGGMMISGLGDGDDALSSFNGRYDGHGIPTVNSGGIHYDSKWDEDKQFLNLNYKIGGMSVKGNNETFLQKNLEDGVLFTHTNDDFKKNLFRQKLDAAYELKLDSSSTLKLNVGGSLANNSTYDQFSTATDRGINMDTIVNRGNRSIDNDGHDKAFSANALWMKKLKKKGRTFSLNVSEYLKNSDVTGQLNSAYDYYTDNLKTSTEVIDQLKTSKTRTSNLDAKITYTEPLSTRSSMVLNYGVSSVTANSDLKSFNKGADGYTELDSTFSNHYQYNQFANYGGIAYSYIHKKTNFNIGTNVSAVGYKQTDEYTMSELKRNFLNWNPNARYTYKFSQSKNFRISYYGSTSQPTLQQIQPVQNNTDNQNITVGNPNLKPAFNNRFNISLSDFKLLTQRYVGLYGGYTLTMDPIVTSVTTDLDSGKSISKYVNLDQNTSNYYGSLYYDRKSEKLGINYGLELSVNGNKYVNYSRSVKKGIASDLAQNITNSNNYTLGLRVGKYKEKVIDASMRASVSYQSNSSTLQKSIDNNSWSYNLRPDIDVFLPGKFQVHTDLSYDFQQKTQSFDARSQTIWNAWIGKKFFKKENLMLKFSANDMLDQNKGFDRSAFDNNISQSYYTAIHRYFMVSLIWDFSKMGGATKDAAK